MKLNRERHSLGGHVSPSPGAWGHIAFPWFLAALVWIARIAYGPALPASLDPGDGAAERSAPAQEHTSRGDPPLPLGPDAVEENLSTVTIGGHGERRTMRKTAWIINFRVS